MARKRMISPEIWESSSFSKLSDFAKLIFIGLISNADDSGKGRANAGFIRSRLFPNDEDRRVTDIKKALSEIALNMSIIFYEVNGDNFYLLENWLRWQKIDRPTPSKIPDPPHKDLMGERGNYTQNHEIEDNTANIRRGLDEGSSLNRIEKNMNGIEKERNVNAHARENTPIEKFLQRWKINSNAIGNYSGGQLSAIDWDKLSARVEKSKGILQKRKDIGFFIKHYADILDGAYDDWEKEEPPKRVKKSGYDEFDGSSLADIQYD